MTSKQPSPPTADVETSDRDAAVMAAIRGVIGNAPAILHEPHFAGNEARYVTDCVKTGWVSSVGSYVDRFERDLADRTGAKHAIACSNGTSALLVAIQLAGVRPGDEVIIPAMTFVATANAVSHAGGVPHLVDIDETTLGMDHEKLDRHLREIIRPDTVHRDNVRPINRHTGRPIAAVVPMHCFGHPCEIRRIIEVADRHGLPVVEDAAESLGSTAGGRHTGTFGRLGMISFNGNKIVTTGGGGAILTDDAELAADAKALTTTAKVPHRFRFHHDRVAYNFRMPNLNAALGCGQLEHLDRSVAAKRELADRYREAFSGVDGVTFVDEPAGTRSNFWLSAIRLTGNDAAATDQFLHRSNDDGVMTRPAWELMNDLPMYADCPTSDLSTARRVTPELVNLPSGVAVAERAGADVE